MISGDNWVQLGTGICTIGAVIITAMMKLRADRADHKELKTEVVENTAITTNTNQLVNGRHTALIERIAFLESVIAKANLSPAERDEIAAGRARLAEKASANEVKITAIADQASADVRKSKLP